MNVLEKIKEGAKLKNKTVVLPEGEDARVVKAASEIIKEGLAKIVLLGNEAEIKANNPDVDLTGVQIIDPLTDTKKQQFIDLLVELRKSKGMTEELAKENHIVSQDANFSLEACENLVNKVWNKPVDLSK